MFRIQGRQFVLKEDRLFNLKYMDVTNWFSLYDTKEKGYLRPDEDGNVNVKENGTYIFHLIPFSSSKKEEDIETSLDETSMNRKSNPYMKFCQAYREKHIDRKMNVKEWTQQWNELDETTKRETYGWKGTTDREERGETCGKRKSCELETRKESEAKKSKSKDDEKKNNRQTDRVSSQKQIQNPWPNERRDKSDSLDRLFGSDTD